MQVVGKEGSLEGGGGGGWKGGGRALGEGFVIRVVLGLGDGAGDGEYVIVWKVALI